MVDLDGYHIQRDAWAQLVRRGMTISVRRPGAVHARHERYLGRGERLYFVNQDGVPYIFAYQRCRRWQVSCPLDLAGINS